MPEVPPTDSDPSAAPPPGGAPSPFRDVPLTPPPAPFGARTEPEKPPALPPPEPEPLLPAPEPAPLAPARPVETPPSSDGPFSSGGALSGGPYESPGAGAPPVGPFVLSTTGVPPYSPPAPLPPFAFGPGVASAGAVAAPPLERRGILRPIARGVRELAETVILALLIFLLVRAVVQNFQVEGLSMEPTFDDGWYLLVNKAIYWEVNLETVHKFVPFVEPGRDPTRYIFRGPQRGDVIVFHPPTGENGTSERDFIKRVIGLPGETIEVRDCAVFIDGKELYEPYINEPTVGDTEPFTVPAGQYFVMGDNRNNSSDSRSFEGVPKENIIGMAWLNYWPFDAFGIVGNDVRAPGDVPADAPDPKLSPLCPQGE